MNKKVWSTPQAVVEKFAANEYVAACWGVACNTAAANDLERELGNNPVGGHRGNECGRFDQQAVLTNDNNVAHGMVEIGTVWGDLPCTLYTDDSFTVVRDASTVQAGETIYWTTQGKSWGSPVYHHVGVVQYTDANRVKHS